MDAKEFLNRVKYRLNGRVINLAPRGKKKGEVLLSYVTLPFLNDSPRVLGGHSNRWEALAMANAFVERGYAVDVIDITNRDFIPKKKYEIFVDNGTNMDRLAPLLGPGCKKVFHATTAHWKFNNDAEEKRADDLFKRRSVRLPPERPLAPNRAIELCDEATLIGNGFTESTYAFAGKPITRTPVSTTHLYPLPEDKDFDAARKNFMWFGGAGLVHKGLDLAIEAFAQMPEYTLTICGKITGEEDFFKIYEKELALPNIKRAGFLDPGSEDFKKICSESIALIYPSCSEGQSGAVVLTMHAGLIPMVSFESGVDVGSFGQILKENSVTNIIAEATALAQLPTETLRQKAVGAWEYAREHHTRENFAAIYFCFVDNLLA